MVFHETVRHSKLEMKVIGSLANMFLLLAIMKGTHSYAVTEDLGPESTYESDDIADQNYSPEYDSEQSTMPEGIECTDDSNYDIGMSQDDESGETLISGVIKT